MTAPRVVRRNANLLPLLRGAAFGALAFAGLASVRFYPPAASTLLTAAAAGLGALSPALAALLLIAAVSLPLLAADLATGALFLVAGMASLGYLGTRKASPFLAVAAALATTAFGAEWAVPVVAGYLLGASEGATAAVLACVAIEAVGLALGTPRLGVVVSGGAKPALELAPVADPLAFKWLADSVARVSLDPLTKSVSAVKDIPLLVAQPLLWGAVAALAGALRRPADDTRRLAVGTGAVAVATLGLAGGSVALTGALGMQLDGWIPAAVVSLVAALLVTLLSDTVFAPRLATPEKLSASEQEDADVDELLRLIAEAEDELASKHTSEAVVLITDMKSFSQMTEEDGSVVSAKMIQRHRDLLLPVIERNGGHGKPTGGDGLVAAFDGAASALRAAIEMQRTLLEFNASRPGERELLVRVGVSAGEVVLDRRGRPFIGNGLNKAARVMGLADGGQVLASGDVVTDAAGLGASMKSLGKRELKNIAEPVEIVEVLWQNPAERAS